MKPKALASEAEHCRRLAPEFRGRPEPPFLLNLAVAFEELALQGNARSGSHTRNRD
jgi:hypothetical protein